MRLREPKKIGIETINACNARCPFCPLFQGDSVMDRERRPAHVMEQGLFKQIVTQIRTAGWRPEAVFLNMNGEPLLDRLFPERIKVLAEAGLARLLELQTNGQFLDDRAAEAILHGGVRRVAIGFDGATKAVYEAHRVRCDYDRVLANIRHLVARRRRLRARTRIVIKFVRTKRNEHEVSAAHALFRGILDPLGDAFQDVPSDDWGDRAGEEGLFERPKNAGGALAPRCEIFNEMLIVGADGKVQACCWDYNLTVSGGGLGNVASEGVTSTWNGVRRETLRRAIDASQIHIKPEKCQTCRYTFEQPLLPAPTDARIPGRFLVGASDDGFTYGYSSASAIIARSLRLVRRAVSNIHGA